MNNPEKYYRQALQRIWQLMQKRPQKNTPEGNELNMLTTLVEVYEEVHYPMQPTDPLAFLKSKMEKENIKQKDLISCISNVNQGLKNR